MGSRHPIPLTSSERPREFKHPDLGLTKPFTPALSFTDAKPLFESRIVNKKLDIVWPCERVIAKGEFH
jgi:hypothetical protein